MKNIKHSILLVVEKPDGKDPQSLGEWQTMSSHLRALASNYEAIEILGENCLLISLHNNLHALCEVLKGMSLDYKYAIFDEDIEWLGKSKEVCNHT